MPDNGEFSSHRYAFMFEPGSYSVDVPVGFYTSVYGLGDSPQDVVFNGERGVYCEEGDYDFVVGALDTFWRSAENFRNEAAFNWCAVRHHRSVFFIYLSLSSILCVCSLFLCSPHVPLTCAWRLSLCRWSGAYGMLWAVSQASPLR